MEDSLQFEIKIINYDELKAVLGNYQKFEDNFRLQFVGYDDSLMRYRYWMDEQKKLLMLGVNVTKPIVNAQMRIYVQKPYLNSTGAFNRLL